MADIAVVILDDHALIRSILPEALSARGITCAGAAGTAEEFSALVDRAGSGAVALVDVKLDGDPVSRQGLEVIRALRWRSPGTPVVVLTANPDPEVVLECYRLGAACFLSKSSSSADDIARAITAARRGERQFPAAVAEVASERRTAADALARPGAALLTVREREVLGLVAAGHDNLKIAAELGITERTVKAHLGALYRKLRAENRVELALCARDLGIGTELRRA